MTDLRAKLTLSLDASQLSRAARAALGGVRGDAAAAAEGVAEIGKKAGSGKAPVYGLGGALKGLMDVSRKGDPGKVLKDSGKQADYAKPKVKSLSDAFTQFNTKIEAGHKKLFALREAAGALGDAGSTLSGVGDKLGGGLAGAAKSSVDFNKQFVDIGVKASMSGVQLEGLRQKTMGLAEEFGTMPGDVAKGIDVLAAAGWDEAKLGGEGLRDMMVAAKLGFSDFNTTAAVGTGIMAVYGSTAADAGQRTLENRDTMLQLANAVNASKISMEDLNYGLQDNMVIAKQAKMSITDLLAVEALLGQKNIKGGVANTATKNLAMLLGNPSKEAQTEMAKLFGSKSKAKLALFDEKGVRRQIPEVLAAVRKQLNAAGGKWAEGTQKRENLMQALFGRDAAGNAADIMNALIETTTDASGKVVTKYEEMRAKIQDTSKAQENMNALNSSTSAQLSKAAAGWENLKITLGDEFLPAAADVAREAGKLLKWGKDIATEYPTATKAILWSAVAVAGLGKVVGGGLSIISGAVKLHTALSVATTSVGLASNVSKVSVLGLGGAVKGLGVTLLTTPLGPMLALAGAVYYAYINCTALQKTLKSIAEEVAPQAAAAVSSMADAVAGKVRSVDYLQEKINVAKDVRDGKLTGEQAQRKLADAQTRYSAGASRNGGARTASDPNAELLAMNQQLQAGMQQVNLPPEVLAAMQQGAGKAGAGVEVTVKDERTIVKKGGIEVPYAMKAAI